MQFPFALFQHRPFPLLCLLWHTAFTASTLLSLISSFVFFHFGHSLHLCSFSLYLKHSTTLPLVSWLSSLPLHTASLYSSILQTYFGEWWSPPLLPFYSCNCRPGAWTSCNIDTTSPSFLLILLSVWWGSIFVWASCSWVVCIGLETLCYVSESIDLMVDLTKVTSVRVQDLHPARHLLPYLLLP